MQLSKFLKVNWNHIRDDTVCHPAIILNCLSVHDCSLGATWAGH